MNICTKIVDHLNAAKRTKDAGRVSLSFMCLTLLVGVVEAKPGAEHIADALKILQDGGVDANARELMSYISQGMDYGTRNGGLNLAEKGSSFWATIRNDLMTDGVKDLKGLGEHHYFGHWDLNGSIPREMLDRIRSMKGLRPDAEAMFKMRWQEFVASRTEAVKQVFNLTKEGSDRYARAFASMVDDVHNLGDLAADKSVSGLRSVEQVTENYLTAANKILGKHNNLTLEVKDAIAKLPRTLPEQQRAREILKILQDRGPEMSKRISGVFERLGFDGVLHSIDNEKIAARLSWVRKNFRKQMVNGMVRSGKCMYQGGTLEKCVVDGRKLSRVRMPVVNRYGKLIPLKEFAEKFPSEFQELVKSSGKSVGKPLVKGAGKALTVKGGSKICKWLSSAKGQGVTAGVLTFLIDEGKTIIEYAEGEIPNDEFAVKTSFNVGKAAVEGVAVYAVATIGAAVGAPAIVVVGGMCVVAIGVEKTGEYVWCEIEKDMGFLPGIGVDDLLVPVSDKVKDQPKIYSDDIKERLEKSRQNGEKEFSDSDKSEPWKTGESFF